jgi:hypothetical protein
MGSPIRTVFVTGALAVIATACSARPQEVRWNFDAEPCTQHVKALQSGFTITSGDVNVVGGDCPDSNFPLPTRAIDLDGSGPPSVTESDRVFEPGEYDLQFDLAGHPFRAGVVLVQFGTLSRQYQRSEHQPFLTEHDQAILKQPSKLRFTFPSSDEVGGGPTIDNIVVRGRR